ncbi:MAG: hypothetical protein ACOC0W_06545 [Desulfosalsimonas sp.]
MNKEKMSSFKRCLRSANFFALKLPCIFIIVAAGFVLELLVTFPFMVLSASDRVKSCAPGGLRRGKTIR